MVAVVDELLTVPGEAVHLLFYDWDHDDPHDDDEDDDEVDDPHHHNEENDEVDHTHRSSKTLTGADVNCSAFTWRTLDRPPDHWDEEDEEDEDGHYVLNDPALV